MITLNPLVKKPGIRFFRRERPIILISGDRARYISKKHVENPLPLDQALQKINTSVPCVCLLLAPYVYSLIQQTIELKRKELHLADRQVLGFSRFDVENRIVESFSLDNQKAITVFSHLSDEGAHLLARLKREKRRIIWKPAISAIIGNLLDYPQSDLRQTDEFELNLEQELLSFKWNSEFPLIKHCTFWNTSQDVETSLQQAKNLMADEDNRFVHQLHPFAATDDQTNSTASLHQLFFPSGRELGFKKIHRRLGSGKLKRLKLISSNQILVFITGVLLIWAVAKQMELNKLKSQRSSLQQSIADLNDRTESFTSLSNPERSVVKIKSLAEAVNQYQLKPQEIIERIESLIPESSWIKMVKITQFRITLELLDYQRTDSSKLMEILAKEFGKIELGENTTIQIEDTNLRLYKITINR